MTPSLFLAGDGDRVPQAGRAGSCPPATTCAIIGAAILSCVACRDADSQARADAAETDLPTAALVCNDVVDGNQDLYLVPVEGGPPRRLTHHPADDMLPRWTPDGRAIVFSSERSGNWQLWELAVGGGEPRRLRDNSHTEWQADVSPDGRRLAFLSNQDGPERLWLMDLPAGSQRVLVRHAKRPILGNPHWSLDGERIVFSSNRKGGHQIYLVEVEDGGERRLTSPDEGACEPRFHPDGRKVVYARRGFGAETSRLMEHDLETNATRTLVDWPALSYGAVYSPDGSEIAFASNVTGEFQIYRLRLEDREARRMTFGPGPARDPDYRPAPGRR